MCISCGCGEGLHDHVDSENITAGSSGDGRTEEQVRGGAEAQGIAVISDA